ncbi:hypothetical protein ACHBTE_22110 [Streptomyces sp. M41]|uniref:hypothetical protein n=1 Tax=Streptomyces sp. M41 TaxID=3059412 RepID=UPI00374DF2C4
MITTHQALKRATSRIVTVGAALGIALALGAASAASAAAAPAHVATKATAAKASPSHGDDGGCSGLIVLLCN